MCQDSFDIVMTATSAFVNTRAKTCLRRGQIDVKYAFAAHTLNVWLRRTGVFPTFTIQASENTKSAESLDRFLPSLLAYEDDPT